LAAELLAAGVDPGDRIAIMLPNGVQFIDALLACSYVGAIASPIPTTFTGDMLRRFLERTSPRAVVTNDEFAVQLERYAGANALHFRPESQDPRAVVVPPRGVLCAEGRWPAVNTSTNYCIYSSSGTTGDAKGVCLPHGALFSMTRTSQRVLNFSVSDITYTAMPLFHANAFVVMFMATALAGGKTVLGSRFSASTFWDEIAASGATKTSLMGAAPAILLKTHERAPKHSLELVMAAPRPADWQEFESRFDTTLTELYGSTEAGLPLGIPFGESQPASCGRLLPGFEAVLCDDDDRPVPPGGSGELLIRPREPWTTASGYWGDPSGTNAIWRNLWIHTGDLMAQDDDGWFYYRDRLKDSIRVSGENIPSADVEDAFTSHPAIKSAAAFGVPSPLAEQDVMVALVPHDGVVLDLRDVLEHVRHNVSKHAVPRYIDVRESLPLTATGKVRKVELRERGVTASTTDTSTLGQSTAPGTS
jgi:crotonobetaine/carnitine-CoA ligase